MNKNLRKTSLDHLNLTVRNFEESADWYGKVFGFGIVERGIDDGRPWGVLKSGDSMLCIYETPDRAAPRDEETEKFHKIYHFGLRIHSREVWEKILREQRLQTHHGSPIRYPHSISWYVTDPTGYMIEVAIWDNEKVNFT